MEHLTILQPLLAQVLLTFFIWCWLIWGRVSTLYYSKINPQKTADDAQAKIIFKKYENQSDNFENLFELPVLFYFIVLLILFFKMQDTLNIFLAWTFVLNRMIHSLVHCTTNRIRHRFYAYFVSSGILWVMWVKFAIQVFNRQFVL